MSVLQRPAPPAFPSRGETSERRWDKRLQAIILSAASSAARLSRSAERENRDRAHLFWDEADDRADHRTRRTPGPDSPCSSQRRTVAREQPSSAAIRRDPQPSAFSRSIAETSSGSFISSLRGPSVHESVSVVMSIIQISLLAHRGPDPHVARADTHGPPSQPTTRAPLKDGDVDAGQGQLSRQHQTCRTAWSGHSSARKAEAIDVLTTCIQYP